MITGFYSSPDAYSPSKIQMALMGSPQSASDFVPSPFRNMDFKVIVKIECIINDREARKNS